MNEYVAAIRQDWRRGPLWMNVCYGFCAYMTLIYLPFDLFCKPVANDHEVWFGFTLSG